MKKALLFSVLFALLAVTGFAQTGKYWASHVNNGTIATDKAVARLSYPKVFKLYDLDLAPLRDEMMKVADNHLSHTTVISLPAVDGGIEDFEIVEASNFEPALQAQFPQIRAFSGRGITDRSATLKISLSPQGIQTMIFRGDKAAEFIEPYSADHKIYSVFTSQRNPGALPWLCTTADEHMAAGLSNAVANTHRPQSNDGTLRTMRLAQSCNGEYANFFGAFNSTQVALVLAAFNATITRCNGCYEKDLAVHLDLIPTTVNVIYYDPATDPYTTLGNWNGQLLTTLKANIGDANFDIGHMFGASGGGGNAGCIGCVCSNGNTVGTYKGSGITSPADGIPMGDNFDIDYVVHEVGHQMGGNHTYSFQNEGTGVQDEVGSGISIMGYAGITGSTDDSAHSIPYYHEVTIQQIQNNLATKTCPVATVITATNATPVIAPVADYTIPFTTPFALTASATDANAADVLTYQWEQNDDHGGQLGGNSGARANKPVGPNWLSFNPTLSPTRIFPRLSTILAGNSVTPALQPTSGTINVEALSSIARTLHFRCTVRDNHPYSSTVPLAVGQTAFTDMTVTVSATAGPFLITSQNAPVTYAGGSTQTVTWSVNGTDVAPINTANVKISWSSDGAGTFPVVLLASTPNDGTETVTIPTGATTTGRIKVEAIGNVYFDINNANITVSAPLNDFVFGTSTASTSSCPAGTPTVTIPVTYTGTFTTPIVLTATGVPAGTTVTFAPNPLVPPANSIVATLNNASTLTSGTYTITVTGTAGATVHTTTITYIINAGTPPVITTQPVNQSVCAPATATFTAASSTAGVTYQWQSGPSTSGPFTNIGGATAASYTTPATTAAMNGTVYHVIISTQCGTVTSSNATLTVNTAAAITAQPTNQSACTGNTATFSVTATGTGVTYQWQSATAVGGPYTNIPGATAATYTTPAVTGATPTFYQVIVTTTTCAGTVTSGVAQLTISTTTAIGTQPTSQTVCAPAAATFTVAATGTGITYQWQVSTVAVPAYTNIAGATAATYNTGATTAAMNGNSYHVVVTGSCNTVTSNNVTLTVNTAAAITGQPAAQTVCNGTTATFTVTATGTGATYQWQSATAVGGPYTNIAGATSATYTIASTTPAMNGTYYQVVITTTSCAGTVTSTPVLLTVNTVATIGTQPANQSACIPNPVTFSVAATGTGLGYQWQISTNGGGTFTNIAGATSATYTINPTTIAMNGNQFRVLVSSTCAPGSPITSSVATLTVNNPVTVTQNPVNLSGCAGDNYTFTVTAASTGTITYQWQVSINGGTTYTNIAGATNASYTIVAAPLTFSGNLYRVIVSGVPCGVITTLGASLTLSNRPSIVLTAAMTSTVDPSLVTGLYTTVSPVGNYVYGWKKNGVLIPNTLSATSLPIDANDAGQYQVTVTDVATGCTSVSNIVNVTMNISNHLFIYPSPVSTTMQVRYYSADASTRGMMLNIYDSKGARVIAQKYTVSGNYSRMTVDMSKMVQGVYMVEVRDASGKKLASAPVVKGVQ